MTVDAALLDASLGDILENDVPIGPLTTYRVGGPARRLVAVDDEATLARVAAAVAGTGVEVLVVGRGSNLLVSDSGFGGLAVRLGPSFSEVEVHGVRVVAGGAASLPVVARRTAREGLTGFEWAVGVPGSIGGAVRMNAGGHGSDMSASLHSVRLVDLASGVTSEVPASELRLRYRSSSIGSSQVVISAELELEPGDRAVAEAEISEIVRWRRANQPGGQNAGSVFTNPDGDSAGRLIDAAGGRGMRIGTAEVSTKHANFIQADEGGSADDVHRLMAAVRKLVLEHHGVGLHPETRLIGFDGAVDADGADGPGSTPEGGGG